MKKAKEIICSENGMRTVNTLFLLSMVFNRSSLMFITYIIWVAYLVFCVKQTESRVGKVIYSIFIGIAVILICSSIYLLVRR